MAKIIKEFGTGMTQKGVLEFDWSCPGDIELQVKGAIAAFERTSFERMSKRLEDTATRILELAADSAEPDNGWQPDSPLGYAFQALALIHNARHHLAVGAIDEAMAAAVAIGELNKEIEIKAIWEQDAITGEKVREGGQNANKRTYGTTEEKAAAREKQLLAFDEAVAGGAPRMAAYKQAARACGVGQRSVERAVQHRKETQTD